MLIEAKGQKQDFFASAGIERIIPLRFVSLEQSGTTLTNATIEAIRQSVDLANEIYRPAGIQLVVRTVEAYQTPTFSTFTATLLPWSSVSQELLQIFPSVDPGGPDVDFGLTPQDRHVNDWLALLNTVYGGRSEVLVFIPKSPLPPGIGCSATGPQTGKWMYIPAGCLGYRGKFAHEFGHYLGIHHPHQLPTGGAGLVDPETGLNERRSDFWDLVYKPGTPNVYFNSKAEAAAQEASLLNIDTGSNCSFPAQDQALRCTVGAEVHQGSANALKGMHFSSNDPYSPIYSYQYGANIMSYYADGTARPNGVSNSQILKIRQHLRYQLPVTDPRFTLFDALSDRHLLGVTSNRAANYSLDFDGDSKRDIAVWVPPISNGGVGTYKLWLSSKSYSSAQVVVRAGGKINDIPVPGNYTGDARADMAFYRSSNLSSGCSAASWYWCPTVSAPSDITTTPSCAEPWTSVQWGCHYDIPFPDLDFDNSRSTPELTVYRPAHFSQHPGTGVFLRKIINGSSNSWYLGGTITQPLPGDYDGDSKTDLVVYNPETAMFEMLFSLDGWSVASKVYRNFSGLGFAPNPWGADGATRSGAVAVSGMYDENGGGKRLALALWDAHTGVWGVNWSPRSSSTINTCQWGAPADIPLGGLGPLSFSSYSDFAVFRHGNFSGTGYVHRRQAFPACGTMTASHPIGQADARTQVLSVQDMDGDGKTDVLVFRPDLMSVVVFTSSTAFSQPQITLSLGEQGVFL